VKSSGQQIAGFAYALGEDVVARLDGVEVYSLDHAALLPSAFYPGWTIATVMEQELVQGDRRYVLRFLLGDDAYVVRVQEAAIDGTV
jgi:hypothetical protein